MDKKTVVISAVNLYLGGTLRIMQDCLAHLNTYNNGRFRVIAIVHDENLYKKYPDVEYISYPKSRKSWLHRLYYEYWKFRKLSRQYDVDYWISIHDMSPTVKAKVRAVYCHNPSPFYKAGWNDLRFTPKFFLFNLFYKELYRINIKKNKYVVVQQQWIRAEFEKIFGISNVVVAPPKIEVAESKLSGKYVKEGDKITFLYPSIPRVFKNFEQICDAVEILEKRGILNIDVYLTIDGSENKYSAFLYKKYKHLRSIHFIGLQTRDKINEYYEKCDCVLFPSKLETWGLPITEAKSYNKPVILADLPYAKETMGKYSFAKFVNPEKPEVLAQEMENFIAERIEYDPTEEMKYKGLFAKDWEAFFDLVLA